MSKPLLLTALILMSPMMSSAAQESRSGEHIAQNSCIACHGAQGNQPVSPDFPRLAGQHKEYIEKALTDYVTGKRKDAVMRAQVMDMATGKPHLSEAEIKAVADYYSRQNGLYVK